MKKVQPTARKTGQARLNLSVVNPILGAVAVIFGLLEVPIWANASGMKTESDVAVEWQDVLENDKIVKSEAAEADAFVKQEPLAEQKTEIAEKMVEAVRRNLTEYIDLQGVVERWAASMPGQAAVEIYDVNYGRVAASYRAQVVMSPKSLYKLFYTYDGYAQIDAGLDDPNRPYLGESTVGRCLDVMIRNSDNPCAEAMLEDPARAGRVATLVRNLGLSQTAANGLSTSAHDVARLMQRYLAHPEWSAGSWTKFLNSALSQPAHLRKGLPSGLRSATVYNKAGFGPNGDGYVYNDAAIVDFAGGRRYIVVAMTKGANAASLASLGAMLERAVVYGG